MNAPRPSKCLIFFTAVVLMCLTLTVFWTTSPLHRGWQPLLDWTCVKTSIPFTSKVSSSTDRSHTVPTLDISTTEPNSTTDLIVHYVRFYQTLCPNQKDHSLNILDCLGLYSVMLNLKPSFIYLHTNVPLFWPFDECESLMNVTINWSPIKVLYAPLQFVASGKRLSRIEHEADIRKVKAVEEYGGLVLDFDVYVINGSEVRRLLNSNPCIICHEGANGIVNAGFFGCQQPHSPFPQFILKESYEKDYNPKCWMCNSGTIPMQVLKRHNGTAVIVDNVCNTPDWMQANNFNFKRGIISWHNKPAYHSWFHNNTFGYKDILKFNSSLGDVFRWILKGSPPDLMGKEIDLIL